MQTAYDSPVLIDTLPIAYDFAFGGVREKTDRFPNGRQTHVFLPECWHLPALRGGSPFVDDLVGSGLQQRQRPNAVWWRQ